MKVDKAPKNQYTEIAWAAGFFDGEGCFHASKPYAKHGGIYVNLSCRVSQKYPELLQRFQHIVGVGTIYSRAQGTIWYYQIASYQGVLHVYKLLYPYLGDLKRQQGLTAIRAYEAQRRINRNKTIAQKK